MPNPLFMANTASESLKTAPLGCAVSILGVIFIWAFHGLSLSIIVISPIAGFLAFAFMLAYWRTRITWLSGMPFVAVLVPCIVGGGFWQILSGILIAAFFQHMPLLVSGRALVSWASRWHG